ncbi:hypothetical protein F5Y16DRAFT_388897 [Xylariaceae sp. FL0255]|nr:hypothetical protein F5Y16DRAFT_388897 [Xylariaceae sp. FL0255]
MALITRDTQLAKRTDSTETIITRLASVNERLGLDSYVDWYLGSSDERWADPAKDAYDAAVSILSKELTLGERQTIWLQGHNSMSDVRAALSTAIQEYETRPRDSKIRTWLSYCSSRFMYYGVILDTLSQHHPEYVSLVWGAMKFLFIAVLNHEELLTELSKAVARIADVLPRTELHSSLYPTKRMQEAVAQVYAKIVEFSILAIKWYKKGRLSHTISSLANPFSLRYKPILEEITERSQRVDQLANAASKAEIRDLHIRLLGLDKRLAQMTEMMLAQQQHQDFQAQTLLNLQSDYKHIFRKGQIEEMQTTLLIEDTPLSEDSLAYCRSMRNRRRQKAPIQFPLSALSKLKEWVSDSSSSLLLAQGRGVRTSASDFAADFLDAVLDKGYPIIWALTYMIDQEREPPSFIALLKSLISQCLNANPRIVSEGVNPITAKHLKSATGIRPWFDVFARCTSYFPRLFILIDMNVVEIAARVDDPESEYFKVSDFVERLSEIITNRSRQQQESDGGLKIAIASWRFDASTSLEATDLFGSAQIFTDMGKKTERMMRQPKFRLMFRHRNQMFAEKLRLSVS